MKLALITLLCSLTVGCGGRYIAVRETVRASGAEAADAALESSRYVDCEAITIGALTRLLRTPEQVASWQNWCDQRVFGPVLPLDAKPAP